MKKIIGVFIVITGILMAGVKTEVTTSGPSATEVITYKGPKARIAVGRFEVKAAKAAWEIGEGIKDMLIDALFRTGRFIVLEKGEGIEDLKEEFQFGEGGWSREAPKKGTFETADIILTGAITAFEPEYKGKGGGGIFIPLPFKGGGAIKIKKEEAYIAAHIRLVDVRTRRVIKTARVEGYASKHKVGILGGGLLGPIALGAGFEKYKNTPMEKAVMVMLDNAVNEIVKSVPTEYYRYTAEGKEVREEEKVEIIGGGSIFKPGKKVIFSENFTSYEIGDIPENWDVGETSVEVALFKGKKWLRFLSDGEIYHNLKTGKDFSFEFEIFITSISTSATITVDGITISPGGINSGICLNSKKLKKKLERKKIHRISISRRKGILRMFVDGKKIYQIKEKPEEIKGSEKIKIKVDGVNPDEGKEFLITDIKIAEY
ncbi:hypothetical protein J7L87_02085 [bacterium]|nr:hypothetical protein [bacterium]